MFDGLILRIFQSFFEEFLLHSLEFLIDDVCGQCSGTGYVVLNDKRTGTGSRRRIAGPDRDAETVPVCMYRPLPIGRLRRPPRLGQPLSVP